MVGKFLQWLGLLALVAALAAVALGVAVVRDRVRIVVQEDAAPAADPIALVRDDLHTVQRDVEALTQALADSLARGQQQAQEQGEQRQRELLAALQAQAQALANLHQRLERAESQWARLEAKAVGAPSAPAAVAPVEPAPAAATPAAPAVALPAVPAAPAAKPAPTGLLGFALPSRRFAFDQPQQFEVLADLSRVGFDARSTLHDFTGVTSRVRGAFTANLGDPAGGWTGAVACDAATLVTGVDGRDAAMRERLDTDHSPQIRFTLQGFTPAPEGIDAKAQTVRGEARGTMTIRGVERPFTLPITARVDESKRLVLEGQAPLKLSEFGVPVPSQLGVIRVEDEVKVWIALRARVRAGSGDGR